MVGHSGTSRSCFATAQKVIGNLSLKFRVNLLIVEFFYQGNVIHLHGDKSPAQPLKSK